MNVFYGLTVGIALGLVWVYPLAASALLVLGLIGTLGRG